MQEVTVKTCQGFERYLWLDGALVRAEDRHAQKVYYKKEIVNLLKEKLFRASPLIHRLLRSPIG